MSLVRENWRERWAHVRAAWVEWDPLGVMPGAPPDEYDSYVGPTLSLLAKQGPLEDLEEFLAEIEVVQFKAADTDEASRRRREFAAALYDWFANLPRP